MKSRKKECPICHKLFGYQGMRKHLQYKHPLYRPPSAVVENGIVGGMTDVPSVQLSAMVEAYWSTMTLSSKLRAISMSVALEKPEVVKE